jgi:hypothetical protein
MCTANPSVDLLTKALSREQTERDRLIKELQQTELKISSYEAALKLIYDNIRTTEQTNN